MIALIATLQAGELTLWHAYRGEERAALEQLCAQWAGQHPGTTVQPLAIPYESMASKIEAAVPRGNGPDLLVFAHDRVADWSAGGIIQPVEALSTSLPSATEALSWQNKVWGWPLAAKSLALFYNRQLLASPPKNTDELRALVQNPLGEGKYWLAYEVASAYHSAIWMHGFNGGVFAGDAVALDRPENVQAFGLIQWLAQSVVPPEPTGALVTQLFNEGRAAMVINGPWFLGEIRSDLDWGVTTLPMVSETGRAAAPYMTVEAVFMARTSPEARELGAWLAGPEAATVRSNQGRQVVATQGIIPNDPVLAAFGAQAAEAIPTPVRPEMGQTWEPLLRALRRLTRGAATPAVAAAEAQTSYAILSRPPPPETAAWPYLGVLGLGLVAAGAWLFPQIRQAPVRKWAFAYAYVAPAFLAMTLLTVLPFVVGAAVSLFEYHEQSWRFVGVAHFLDILLARDFPVTSPLSFWSTLVVTILWTVANVALHVSLGVALALLLREPWVRLRGVFRAALILPWAIPSYITALVWKNLFHQQFGAINAILVALGLEPVSWFASFSTAFAANLCTNTWLGFPFMMVVTLGALQSIPRDLEEAAEVDGANALQRFQHVTLPLLKPALLPAVILGSVWTFNMFNIIYLVSGGEPDGSTEILISQAYRWAFTRGHRYGYAAAYAVIIFGVLVLYGRVANRLAGKKVL